LKKSTSSPSLNRKRSNVIIYVLPFEALAHVPDHEEDAVPNAKTKKIPYYSYEYLLQTTTGHRAMQLYTTDYYITIPFTNLRIGSTDTVSRI
jgi:hypothetical protein